MKFLATLLLAALLPIVASAQVTQNGQPLNNFSGATCSNCAMAGPAFTSPATLDGWPITPPIILTNVTGNSTFVIPAGYAIRNIYIRNTTFNAVTGGIKIGTASGLADVVLALAIPGTSDAIQIGGSSILKFAFSATSTQTLYLQAVTAWNSANLTIYVYLEKATQ